MNLRILLCLLFLVICTVPSPAAITPASIFTDNAVLQQKMPLSVWGTGDPDEPIHVTVAGREATTKTNPQGKWSVTLKPLNAGGPYTLTISGNSGDTVTLKNILVGEVWICGGQSNMFYPLKGFPVNPATAAAIPLAHDPLLHIAIVSLQATDTPQTTCSVKWQEATPETVPDFSAVGYFFGRDLRKALGVPVGLIESCVGGTSAQAWTSREALQAVPSLNHYLRELEEYTNAYPAALQKYNDAKPAYDAAIATWKTDLEAAKSAGTPSPNRPRVLRAPVEPARLFNVSMRLYNGMIAPLIPYTIKGVIWYQGEGNWDHGWDYKTLFPTLIADWRGRWGEGDFPFLYVQLAGDYPPSDQPVAGGLPEVREAQRLTLTASPHTGMVTIVDAGDQANIHPARKEVVGSRLAMLARGMVYGAKLEMSGPMYDKCIVEGGAIRVTFTHADGLHTAAIHDVTDDGPIVAPADKATGFFISGSDQVFHAADAHIDGHSVLVSSPSVPSPVAVRYGWSAYPLCNLVNSAGLWASPFKSDDWRWSSTPKGIR